MVYNTQKQSPSFVRRIPSFVRLLLSVILSTVTQTPTRTARGRRPGPLEAGSVDGVTRTRSELSHHGVTVIVGALEKVVAAVRIAIITRSLTRRASARR